MAIEQLLEEQEEYLIALAAYEKQGKRYSAAEVEKILGLKDDKLNSWI